MSDGTLIFFSHSSANEKPSYSVVHAAIFLTPQTYSFTAASVQGNEELSLKLVRIKIFVEIIYHESYDRRTIADVRKTWKA